MTKELQNRYKTITRKIFVIILLIISFLILILSSSCSNDPRVAPTKLFLLSVESNGNRILYDEEYNSRVIYLNLNETVLLKVITNRLGEPKNLKWYSNVENVASVKKRNDNEGLVTALDYGVSLISVIADYSLNDGTCYIIVRNESENDGINIIIDNIFGLVKSSDDKYEINASSISELKGKHLNLHYENENGVIIEKVEWYINGILYSSESELNITFDSFGKHTVDCIVYRKCNGTVVPIGTSSIEIKVNNI